LISRLRLDAQLYAFPDPNAPRRRGPKPLKGQWLTALKARVAAAVRDGTDLEIPYAPTYRRLLYVTNSIGLAVGDQVADSIRQGLQ